MKQEDAVVDLPPAPPAYVEILQNLSPLHSTEVIETLKHVPSKDDNHGPPHDHYHVEELPPPPEPEPPDESLGMELGIEVARWRWKQNEDAQRMAAIRFYEMNGEA